MEFKRFLSGCGIALCLGSSIHTWAADSAAPAVKAPITVPGCTNYFQRGIWRFDINIQRYSLSLIPEQCTRDLKGSTNSTGLIVDAIIRDYSSSTHWGNTHGMRHQLICHLDILNTKTEWNIEPGRQDVGYEETVRNGCNPPLTK